MLTMANTSNQPGYILLLPASLVLAPPPTQILTTSDMHFSLSIILQQGFPTNVTLHTGPLIYVYFTALKCVLR